MKDIRDRPEALGSYAKQAGDDSLRRLADRIQARAIRRCGELLKQIPPSPGGRPRNDMCAHGMPYGGLHCGHGCGLKTREGDLPSITRTDAAESAGLSEHQRKTALRVANVPAEDFEAAVESDSPPTVTQLAARGTQSRPAPQPLVDRDHCDSLYRRASRALKRFE